MAVQERDPRAYELMTIFLPDLPEEDNQAQLDRVSGYLASAGGSIKEVLTESPWGRRRLAYAIRFNSVDFRDGFFTVYHFDAAPSALAEIERDLKLDTSTMRYLLVHDDPKAGEKFPQQDQEGAEPQGDATAAPARSTERSRSVETTATTATVASAPDDAPSETLTEEAVTTADEPVTEAAPEQADPESTLVPESEVVSTQEPEGERAPESNDHEAKSEVVGTEEPKGEPAPESNDDEAESEVAGTEESLGEPAPESNDDEANKE